MSPRVMRECGPVVPREIADDLGGIDKKRYCVNLLSQLRESWYTIQGLKGMRTCRMKEKKENYGG